MTEIAKLITAKDYMDKLSNGINPVNDEVLTIDVLLNNVNLSRCFFYVSDILRQVIENDGFVAKKARSRLLLSPFELSDEMRRKIEITTTPTTITPLAKRINALIDENTMRKLKVTALTGWLVENGLLCEEIINERKRKTPTEAGEKLGIYSETIIGHYGSYLSVFYKESAQRYIVDNLDQIIKLSN